MANSKRIEHHYQHIVMAFVAKMIVAPESSFSWPDPDNIVHNVVQRWVTATFEVQMVADMLVTVSSLLVFVTVYNMEDDVME